MDGTHTPIASRSEKRNAWFRKNWRSVFTVTLLVNGVAFFTQLAFASSMPRHPYLIAIGELSSLAGILLSVHGLVINLTSHRRDEVDHDSI